VSGALIADAVPLGREHVHYEPAFDKVPSLVAGLVGDGDLVLTMGAGDVTSLGPELLKELDRA
jgi:UDP-N-acetylmuramate--alanine ligase